MFSFGIKDIIDILIVALLLYTLYKMMKESGTISIFTGVLAFVGVWIVVTQILDMRLIGSIMDKFMSVGLLILVILFQDEIKRFLVQLGSHKRWRFFFNFFFKNSPLHDGAMIIADDRIASAACILPVSHNTRIPKSMGLRHRSALGITEVTDALAVVVSEETGNISLAHNGKITTKISGKDLERMLAQESID